MDSVTLPVLPGAASGAAAGAVCVEGFAASVVGAGVFFAATGEKGE
jgi:hypothetical protein